MHWAPHSRCDSRNEALHNHRKSRDWPNRRGARANPLLASVPATLDFGNVLTDPDPNIHSCPRFVVSQSHGNPTFEKRGHLPTQDEVTTVSEREAKFVGAGPMGKGSIKADHILDLRYDRQEKPRWYGLVCRTGDSSQTAVFGERPDGTSEIWDLEKPEYTGVSLQEMTWNGDHPSAYISEEVQLGIQLAQTIVDTIIHPVEQ